MIQYEDTAQEILERFVRYARICTTSDGKLAETQTPSTPGQWDLLRLLETELKDMGVDDVTLDQFGYLIARLPGNRSAETIGFMAHVDTSSDAPGDSVQPQIHSPYDGKIIRLKDGITLDPADMPLLASFKGETIITSDGSTLLGADDKAGVAEIMTAVHWLTTHPEFPRGNLEIIFTPDEETGSGMNRFPAEQLKSGCCFTLDGSGEGEIETECYYAQSAELTFKGRVVHPGTARGKLVNAVSMAGMFIGLLPRSESPEATDGRYGNYWPQTVTGSLEEASLTVMFRSFSEDGIERRADAVRSFAAAVEAAFPGGRVVVEIRELYRNMREEIAKHPQLTARLNQAVLDAGTEPVEKPIRGGTDGSRLTAMGIPTPNIFTGGQNYHSRSEWVALPVMFRAVRVILNLVKSWTSGS